MTFEENLARLEALVETLGEDDVELGRALALFEEGIALLRAAAAELAKAEAQVKLLVQQADGTFDLPDHRG